MTTYCLSLLFFMQALLGVQGTDHSPTVEVQQKCKFECLIDVIGFLYSEAEEADEHSTEHRGDDMFLCRLHNDAFRSRAGYRVELPQHFLEPNKKELLSASAYICISSGAVDRESNRIIVAPDADISMLQGRRKLQTTVGPITGTRTILAVQLTSSFMSGNARVAEDPQMTQSEIEGSIFGSGNDAPGHDLISQYRDCSFGALNLVPASGTNIQNGVAEVRLRKSLVGGEILGSLQDEILHATEERVGSLDQFDNIIYCIPDGALMDGTEKWTAFTYFHSPYAFFQKRRCSAMSVTIHEVGHNLGFRHSGYNAEDYGDESGYMGFTIYQTGAPVKCFNAHKNWVAGWFKDRQHRVNPSMESPVLARLVTFVDYDKDLDSRDVVLIRVGHYFIQYNRAKGINVDTGMHKDKVSITYAPDALTDSEAIVGLSAEQTGSIEDYRNTGHDLMVEVCEIGSTVDSSTSSIVRQTTLANDSTSIDYAWVSIYLDNGQQRSQCDKVSASQTPQPSPHPTTLPPSDKPTQRPSSHPTPQPTSKPTSPPSSGPSLRPTPPLSNKPTLQPTPSPVSARKPTDLVEFSVQLRPQKRKQEVTIKDVSKLARDQDEAPAMRRRLKGGR